MALRDLDEFEKTIIAECLRASVDGPFFPEWEFHTLFGLTRDEVREVLDAWPDVDESSQNAELAINNSLGNLIGYPHRMETDLMEYVSVSPEEIARIFNKWKAIQEDAQS